MWKRLPQIYIENFLYFVVISVARRGELKAVCLPNRSLLTSVYYLSMLTLLDN